MGTTSSSKQQQPDQQQQPRDPQEQQDEEEADTLAEALDKLRLDDNQKVVVPDDASITKIAALLQASSNILVVAGAGVSVAAGIPDFRTPGTGLYDNLEKFNLPYAEAVFDVQYYRKSPQAFCQLAAEIWPQSQKFKPTLTHCFLKLLEKNKKLLRIYTQNIDGLEQLSNISEQKLVECHGHFRSSSCIDCKKPADNETVVDSILVQNEAPVCRFCGGYVKPDIVFFGEQLPDRFHAMLRPDLKQTDLCIVLGTSLQVPPVAFIPEMVNCRHRILLNREDVLKQSEFEDYVHLGDVDDSVVSIAEQLGWKDELIRIHAELSKDASDAETDETPDDDDKGPSEKAAEQDTEKPTVTSKE